ncbi:hypothetical protein NA56DRAFT_699293 [Hyaloscypha hepaticicola]|uniref:Uncharacterized protein n=1 Tax=Hyaloscypha hepaticicola TaxID=2082293 RepID=A0A2J6QGJ2_9HELO|nr:hypothetical protein NA56DRAFT_699293 [Hyaloscypha hepaticicola]
MAGAGTLNQRLRIRGPRVVVDDGTHDREPCRVGTPQPEKLIIEFQVLLGGIHKQLSRTLGKMEASSAFFDVEEKLSSFKHKHEHEETQPPLTEFPMFTTLSVELQDEVWKCYVVQNP